MNRQLATDYINDNFTHHSDVYNVDSMYISEKMTDGKPTGKLAIVYTVRDKISINDISTDNMIPESVNIDGVDVFTDVVEQDIDYQFEGSCHDINDQTGAQIISRNRRLGTLGGQYDITRRTGMSCMNLTHSINYKNTHSASQMFNGIKIGTMGCFAVDEQDGKLVILSNNHVLTPDFMSADEQGNNPMNYRDNVIVTPADDQTISGTYVTPGYMTTQERTIVDDVEYKLGEVKRSYPLYRLNNEIDAAICSTTIDYTNTSTTKMAIKANLGNSDTRGNSWIPVGMNIDYNMRWATSNEIDSLAVDQSSMLFKSGWATGSVGSPGMDSNKDCEMYLSAAAFTGFVSGKQFKNVIQYKGRLGLDPSSGGDSGSPLCALIDGTWKLIGIHFAGGRDRKTGEHHALACRIDKISQRLKIKWWDGINAYKKSINNFSNTVNPTYATIAGHQRSPTMVIDGKTYYQVGRTDSTQTHTLVDDSTTHATKID